MFGRHAGANRHPEVFENPGFRVALAIASLPGMTIELCCELLFHDTSMVCWRAVASAFAALSSLQELHGLMQSQSVSVIGRRAESC
jgi:hypothetical protein